MKCGGTMYYIYIIRCEDSSLYCGITTDVSRRFSEHINGKSVGAKYTRSRKPKQIEMIWSCETRSDALKLESSIKKLTKIKKEELISDSSLFDDYFNKILDIKLYKFEQAKLNEIINRLQQVP